MNRFFRKTYAVFGNRYWFWATRCHSPDGHDKGVTRVGRQKANGRMQMSLAHITYM